MEAELPRNPIDEFKQGVNCIEFEDVDTVPENDVLQLSELERYVQQAGQLHGPNLRSLVCVYAEKGVVYLKTPVGNTDHFDRLAEFKVIEQTGIASLFRAVVVLLGKCGEKCIQPGKQQELSKASWEVRLSK